MSRDVDFDEGSSTRIAGEENLSGREVFQEPLLCFPEAPCVPEAVGAEAVGAGVVGAGAVGVQQAVVPQPIPGLAAPLEEAEVGGPPQPDLVVPEPAAAVAPPPAGDFGQGSAPAGTASQPAWNHQQLGVSSSPVKQINNLLREDIM